MAAESTTGSVTSPPKSKSKRKKTVATEPKSGRIAFHREAVGLFLVLGSIAVFLALVSFDIADLDAAEPGNLIGPLGVWLASNLLFVFGLASFFLNLVVAYLGLNLLVGRPIEWRISYAFGQILFVLSAAILSHLFLVDFIILGHIPGGLLGEVVAEGLRGVVGTVGTALVGLGALVYALMLAWTVSVGGLVRWMIAQMHRGVAYVRHQWRVNQEFRARLADERVNSRQERDVVSEVKAHALVEGTPLVPDAYEFEQGLEEEVEKKLSAKLRKLARSEKPKGKKVEAVEAEATPAQETASTETIREKISAEIERDSHWELGEVISSPEPKVDDEERATPTAEVEPAQVEEAYDVSDSDIVDLVVPEVLPRVDLDFGPQIVESEAARKARERRDQLQDSRSFRPLRKGDYELPSPQFLNFERSGEPAVDPEQLRMMAAQIEKTLADFKVDGQIVEICPGPVITMFEFSPGPGLKISKIAGLQDDLAMALSAHSVRILAPIPGKGVVGIEVPNPTRDTVYLKEVITDEVFSSNKKMELPLALGFDTEGGPIVADLAKMPHLLVAGATGAGKSVAVNTMIVSLLYKHTPDDVRFLMVDPKMLEFSIYADIPHLLLPVVTDPKQATVALNWAVQEMERRYQKLSEMGVRNIKGYNDKVERMTKQAEIDQLDGKDDSEALRLLAPDATGKPAHVRLPYIVVIIDEFADLMMTAAKDVETAVARLAQKARAAGIHLILATQRPSTDVITGLIKANFPTRIALRVTSKTDSRVILDSNGAENLLGNGDMLFVPPGSSNLTRVHGAFVSENEIDQIVKFLKDQGKPVYDESILVSDEDENQSILDNMQRDEYYEEAVRLVVESRQASISMIQRRLQVGYNRAARMVEMMELEGLVSAPNGAKPREVIVDTCPY